MQANTETKADSKTEVDKYTIIIDKMPSEFKVEDIVEAIKEAKFTFKEVTRIAEADYTKFGIGQQMALTRNARFQQQNQAKNPEAKSYSYFCVSFETKEDLKKLAYDILFEKSVKVNKLKKLHMMIHNKKGNYNPETSVCIQQLNYACTKEQIVEELNIVLRDNRTKVAEKDAKNPEEVVEEKPKDFILSSIVFIDNVTKMSKQFAFVDFSSAQAAQVCVKAWNDSKMNRYPNRLSVTKFDDHHIKLTKEERDRTKTREKVNHTNLFVEKLPYIFKQEDVLNLFQKYGSVIEVKIKKPNSNVQL